MEPYWNQVRLDQVIGRARRICSHNTLPHERDRFVEVHMYMMELPKDIPSGILTDWDDRMTTEEYLYDLSDRKKKINSEILNCLKLASIDCHLYDSSIKLTKTKDKLALAYHANIQNDDTTEQVELNVKKNTMKYITVKGERIVQFDPTIKDSDGYVTLYLINTNTVCGYTKDENYYDVSKTAKLNVGKIYKELTK